MMEASQTTPELVAAAQNVDTAELDMEATH